MVISLSEAGREKAKKWPKLHAIQRLPSHCLQSFAIQLLVISSDESSKQLHRPHAFNNLIKPPDM